MTRTITARYRSQCPRCGHGISAGERVSYDVDARKVQHLRGQCPQGEPPAASTTTTERTEQPAPGLDATIGARAAYKGRTYYVAARETRDGPVLTCTRDGSRMLLYFRDGSRQFWAPATEVEITKRYRRLQTIQSLQDYAEEARQAKAQGYEDGIAEGRRYVCDECGDWVTRGDGTSCWETGAAH